MDLTYFLAQLFGYYLIIVGILFLFRAKAFGRAMGELAKSEGMLVFAGLGATLGGFAIVLSHNIWDAGHLALLVTLFGWAVLLKGLGLLFVPEKTIAMWTRWSSLERYGYVYGAVTLLIGLYLLHGGVTHTGLLG